jgi:hypothetical protein
MEAIISLGGFAASPLLSHRCALREEGRSLRCGAALARLPSPGACRFHAQRPEQTT